MTDSPQSKWSMTAEAMERLLRALASDRDAAAASYELLRRRLIKFFQWERCPDPAQCADEAIDRLARRLESGESIADIPSYALGVARLVRKEALGAARRDAVKIAAARLQVTDRDQKEEALACLEECLDSLPASDRELLVRYYLGSGRDRIERRRQMAAELRTSVNALRNRALRLRDRLEGCVRDRLAQRKTVMNRRN